MATAEDGATSGSQRPKPMSAVMTRRMSVGPGSGKPRRAYSAYTVQNEPGRAARYDQPRSGREWWRSFLRDTPTPGSYQINDFLTELNKRSATYGFRDVPRDKKPFDLQRTGSLLLPGAYEHKDFLEESAKKAQSYCFKSVGRDRGPKIGHGYFDKDINTTPNQYNIVDYSEGPKKNEVKSSSFKSAVKRKLECDQFRITPGPGPGLYDGLKPRSNTGPSSAFRSRVPRFGTRFGAKVLKVPGPGTYAIGCEGPPPLPAVVTHLRIKHGINLE